MYLQKILFSGTDDRHIQRKAAHNSTRKRQQLSVKGDPFCHMTSFMLAKAPELEKNNLLKLHCTYY